MSTYFIFKKIYFSFKITSIQKNHRQYNIFKTRFTVTCESEKRGKLSQKETFDERGIGTANFQPHAAPATPRVDLA
jgi:hypothetical protein